MCSKGQHAGKVVARQRYYRASASLAEERQFSLLAGVQRHACEQAEPALFGERGARAVVSVPRNHLARVQAVAAQYEVAASEVGTVVRGPFSIKLNERLLVSADVPLLAEAWSGAIERLVLGLHAPGQL